jgi:hypothetical protein
VAKSGRMRGQASAPGAGTCTGEHGETAPPSKMHATLLVAVEVGRSGEFGEGGGASAVEGE